MNGVLLAVPRPAIQLRATSPWPSRRTRIASSRRRRGSTNSRDARRRVAGDGGGAGPMKSCRYVMAHNQFIAGGAFALEEIDPDMRSSATHPLLRKSFPQKQGPRVGSVS